MLAANPGQVGSNRCSGCSARGGQPGAGRREHRLDANPQSGVEDRRKLRRMIGWQLVQSAGLLGFGIFLRIGAADEPEDQRRLPGPGKDAEILARSRRIAFLHVAAEAALERRR